MTRATRPAPPELEDPVALAVHEARRLAPERCARDTDGTGSCAWYHECWAVLRALRVVTAPAHHHAFYTERLGDLAAGARAFRVLVCGTADYAMPATVIGACAGAPLDLDVLDRCATPLALTRWYATRQGFSRLETLCLDALELEARAIYDVVCTHSFLGYFTPSERVRLARAWARALKPGGSVLLVHRIRPADAPEMVAFTPAEAERLRARARQALQSSAADFGVSADELDRLTAAYTRAARFRSIRSEEELLEPLEKGGLRIAALRVSGVAGSEHASSGGPTTPGGARYAMVEAVPA